jgi:hypothetical protein
VVLEPAKSPKWPPKPQGGHVWNVAPLGEVGPLGGDGGDL